MKKILSLICILLVIWIFSSDLIARSYKIGCVEDYFPYTSVDEYGEMEGVIIDWWKLWSIKTGNEVEFIRLDIQSCTEQIESGRIDVIASLFYHDDRTEHLDFLEPLMRMKTILFLKNKIVVDSIQNIANEIGLVENSLAHLYLQEKYPQIKLRIFKSYASLRNNIHQQKTEGFIYDLPNPIDNYKELPAPKGYYKFETLFTEKLRPAVKKGNTDLFNLIMNGANKFTNEDIIEIAEKSELYKKDQSSVWLMLIVGFIMSFVIVILLINSIRNKKKATSLASIASKTDLQVLIDNGENELVEFKSSLMWDFGREKESNWLQYVVVKAITAFLNTEGGTLIIGVDDNGKILGLEFDYNCLSKNNRDGFLLSLTSLVNQKLGRNIHKFLRINIVSFKGKDVCIVSVEKSDSPVFLGKNENEKFYIRASASSQPLAIQETHKYINSHWGK